MATTRTDQRQAEAAVPAEPVVDSRIDAPHQPATTSPEAASTGAAVSPTTADAKAGQSPPPPPPEALAQIVRTQASQLAEHLRSRQKELDHREAELNARAAQLDRDARTARLWLDERMAELDGRAKAADRPAEAQEPTPLRFSADALTARSRQLEEAEARLETQRTETLRWHQELKDDRHRLEEDVRSQREQLAAERARLAADADHERRAIGYRSEQLDQSRAALEQLRKELGQMHRETLEIRLATEELWAQLCGVAVPAAVVQSMGRIRAKLAEHYRLANSELQQHREEIERLRTDLAEQHERLVCRKRQVDQWASGCREEVEQQSARLAAQADDLGRREAELRQQSNLWQVERLRLQQEIRRSRIKAAAQCEMELPV